MKLPEGSKATYVLSYEEFRSLIDQMRFNADSDLFGHEKDDSFKGSIGNIYQSFGGEDIYPTLEEKAANLLYFVTKNHSFSDRNKRIAATIFLYFLDKNGILYNENGNLAKDLNKKIVEKEYNSLNLPQRVEFKNESTVSYLYDADVIKLRTVHKIQLFQTR